MGFFPVVNRAGIDGDKYRNLLRQFLIGVAGQAYLRRSQLRMQAAFAQINRPDRFREKQIYRHSRIGFANDFAEMLLNGFRGQKRSEEHTSELQSRFDLVCRLLLEKKKKYQNKRN